MSDSERSIPSKKHYISLKNWSKERSAFNGQPVYREFKFKQSVPLVTPKGIDKELHEHFRNVADRWEKRASKIAARVAVIENGRIYGIKGVLLTPDNKVLKSVTKAVIENGEKRLPDPRSTNQTIGVLAFKYTHNYFHWMLDILPRIKLLRKSEIPIDKYLISRPGKFPYEEMLDTLGIPKEKIIMTDENFHLKAKKMVVVDTFSGWGRYEHFYPKWACDFLRNELSACNKNNPSKKYERIYISRARADRRNVRNEDEVRKLLKEYGFRCIHLESLSHAEQIRVFQSAQIIVAPHGAALANLVFTNPDTKLIEIFSPKYVREYYWIISSYMKLDYYYLIGEDLQSTRRRHSRDLQEDIVINLNSLSKLLKMADIHKK